MAVTTFAAGGRWTSIAVEGSTDAELDPPYEGDAGMFDDVGRTPFEDPLSDAETEARLRSVEREPPVRVAEQPALFQELMKKLHPRGLEDLVLSVQEWLEKHAPGEVLGRLDEYLRATVETGDLAEKVFRAARLVTVLAAGRMAELFREVTAAKDFLTELMLQGRSPRPPEQLPRWEAELRQIEGSLEIARQVALRTYPVINPKESHFAKMYLQAEKFSLEAREDAIDDALLGLMYLSRGSDGAQDDDAVFEDIAAADENAKDYAIQVIDELVLTDVPLSLFDFVPPVPEFLRGSLGHPEDEGIPLATADFLPSEGEV